MIFSGIERQGRHVDGDVQDAEEGKRKHGRDSLYNGTPVDQVELCHKR